MTGKTHYQVTLELDYALRVSERHERLFRRIKKGMALLTVLAGSAALYTLAQPHPGVTAAAAVMLAVIAAVDLVYDPQQAANAHRADIEALLALRATASTVSAEALDSALNLARQRFAPCVEGLRLPAHNDVLLQHGHDDLVEPLTPWQQVLAALA